MTYWLSNSFLFHGQNYGFSVLYPIVTMLLLCYYNYTYVILLLKTLLYYRYSRYNLQVLLYFILIRSSRVLWKNSVILTGSQSSCHMLKVVSKQVFYSVKYQHFKVSYLIVYCLPGMVKLRCISIQTSHQAKTSSNKIIVVTFREI